MKSDLRCESGQDLLEYALILPLLLLLLFGIMEFGILFFSHNTIANAAREGARSGIVPGATETSVETVTRNMAGGLNNDPSRLGVQVTFSDAPSTVQVTVIYTTTWLTPVSVVVGGDGTVVLRARTTMNRE